MTGSNDTRFRKGRSGNPAGRPKSRPRAPSVFDIVMDRTLAITDGGKTREMTIDEALQHKTYEQAIAGSRMARRTILKMIARREKALAAAAPPPGPVVRVNEPVDPGNAFDALCLLGIAAPDPAWPAHDREPRLLLEPWAVQLALGRRGLRHLGEGDLAEIARCTGRPETLIWPARFRP